ncbi:MAG: hypothetical protein Q9198_011182, partial [Flavoplaca austrocitrina]
RLMEPIAQLGGNQTVYTQFRHRLGRIDAFGINEQHLRYHVGDGHLDKGHGLRTPYSSFVDGRGEFFA